MRKFYLFLMISCCQLLIAQTNDGNTINEAIPVDGTNIALQVINYDNSTSSGMLPACDTSEDVFYAHTISPGDNKLTIGLSSAAISLFTSINYQIFVAPNGDLNNLNEVTCDDYDVVLIVGGGFQTVIENINSGDVYYLRVFKPGGLLPALTSSLLSGSSIAMVSEFDATLSTEESTRESIKYAVNSNQIRLLNNRDYDRFHLYNLTGKKITSNKERQFIETIDIDYLHSGLYILVLENDSKRTTFKFIK
jgi:hypothetical protein